MIHYTLSQTPPSFYILNNLANSELIVIIVGAQNHEKISHQIIRHSPASLTCLSHIVLAVVAVLSICGHRLVSVKL